MKKILALLLAVMMVFSLVACGAAKEDTGAATDTPTQQDTQTTDDTQQPDAPAASATDWPANTIFPKPEGCKIIEVKSESYKNYITVEWDSMDAAKAYIEAAKTAEGDDAEVIGSGETDDSVFYGTYGITISSLNEAENIVLYK